ncbi:hypothetical protein L345_15006, partial [Ophiophagus hannah]
MASSVGGEGDSSNSSGSSADWQGISLRASTLGMVRYFHLLGRGPSRFRTEHIGQSSSPRDLTHPAEGSGNSLRSNRGSALLQKLGLAPWWGARIGTFFKAFYDWCSWIPNAPPTMRCPPPTEKGKTTIEYIIKSLPDRGRSCWHLGAVWALSQFQENEVFLGIYPDEHFTEKPVKEAMRKFRKNLDGIASYIAE